MITIVGLGAEKGDLTKKGAAAIKGASSVAVRSFKTKAAAWLKNKGAVSFDGLYQSCADFDELNAKILDALLCLQKENGSVVFCVDGDGCSDPLAQALKEKTDIEIIRGVMSAGLAQSYRAASFFSAASLCELKPLIDTALSISVCELDDALIAGEVKLILLDSFSPSAEVVFSRGGKAKNIPLEELDRQSAYGYGASVFIPAQTDFSKERYCMGDLMRIMSRLTAADGCEWDKVQTHASIRINAIEEAYEVADAIDACDMDALIEETGDLMLQTVFHSDIALRSGEYNFGDVVSALCKKLVTRHTHIFGKNHAGSAAAALNFWEAAKAEEKKINTLKEKLESLPKCFPAALKTEKALSKALKHGLKLDIASLESEVNSAIASQEVSRALFYSVALCVAKGQNPEAELNSFCTAFIRACSEGEPVLP